MALLRSIKIINLALTHFKNCFNINKILKNFRDNLLQRKIRYQDFARNLSKILQQLSLRSFQFWDKKNIPLEHGILLIKNIYKLKDKTFINFKIKRKNQSKSIFIYTNSERDKKYLNYCNK